MREEVLEIGVLGPLTVTVDGRPLPDVPQQERTILSLLALQVGRPIAVETIIDALWPARPPKTPRKSVQVLVYRLRRRLETELAVPDASPPDRPVIETVGEAYVLMLEPDAIDAERFERLVAEARAARGGGDLDRAIAVSEQAQALWRGDPVPDLADTEQGQAARARLDELRLGADEDRFEDLLDLRRHAEAVGALEAGLAANPLRERRWRQLMVALYRSGRQADALRAYQRIRTKLVDELGIEPGPDLQRLEAAIIAHDPALELTPTPAPAPPSPRPVRAAIGWAEPRFDLPLVGRAAELARLRNQWAQVRRRHSGGLVLLTGEAGMGKTRLAAELAVEAAVDGATVRAGRCSPTVELSAFREAFPDLAVPDRTEDDSSAIVDYAAAVCDQLVVDAPTSAVMLIVEDLDRADGSTLAVLRAIVPVLRSLPTHVLATYREGGSPPPGLAALLAEVHRVPIHSHVALTGLPPTDAAALLAERLGRPEGDPADLAAATIAHETGGRPLALIEMANHLLDTGLVSAGHWTADGAVGLDTVGIPQTLARSVHEQAALVPDESRELLMALAVLGMTFGLDDAVGVSGRPDEQVLDLLEAAIEVGLVGHDPGLGDRFAFTTAVERVALRDALAPGRRFRVERDLREQGRMPVGVERGEADTGSALGPAAEARLRTGDVSGAWELYRRAIDVAQEIGDPRLLGQSAVGAARVLVHLEVAYPPIIELLVRARDGLAPDEPLRAEVDTALIREYLWAGRWDEAMRISQAP